MEWDEKCIKHQGETYRVRTRPQDIVDEADNPRHHSPLGRLVLTHRRYTLPRESDLADRILDGLHTFGFATVERWLRVCHGATLVLPVWGFDHSGLAIRAGTRVWPFDCPWDSGPLGIIFDNGDESDGLPFNTIRNVLFDEVARYDRYQRGELFDVVVEQATPTEWVEVAQHGGYTDADDALADGIDMVRAGDLAPVPHTASLSEQASIVNLTPHPLHRYGPDNTTVATLPQDGRVARIAERVTGRVETPHGPVALVDYGEVEGLPDPQPGVYYVVPLPVALATRRADLLVPYDHVRNGDGTVIGCRSFSRVH